jgi:hypothetical protein
MDSCPDINAPIVVRDLDGRTYPSRVEDVSTDALTIARPLNLPAEHPVDPGTEVEVGWTSWRGVTFLRGRLVRTRSEGAVRLWVLAITGESWREQRRDFVRTRAAGPVTLRPLGCEPEADAVAGQLVDVSEAALCCTVEGRSASALADGAEVSVCFRFGDGHGGVEGDGDGGFELRGRVSDRRPGIRSASLLDLVVTFDDPGRAADRLRREIFAEQLRRPRR